MSELWPLLPGVVADREFDELVHGVSPHPGLRHPEQTYGVVGAPVTERRLRRLVDDVTTLAGAHGLPRPAGPEQRIAFDRACAPLLRESMDLSWADAGNREIWSFLALVALPHVTAWRFGTGNRERWVGSDLTRHTWARLWWQAVAFAGHDDLLNALSESDLNQLLERRTIAGDPHLLAAFAAAVVKATSGDEPRRTVIRDASARLVRVLAFLDPHCLTDDQLADTCTRLVGDTVDQVSRSN